VFVEDILKRLLGPHVNIISTGPAVARQAHRLSANPLPDAKFEPVRKSISVQKDEASDAIQLWTTGSIGALQHAADRWLDLPSACCHWIAPSAH
jgi:glutamate racemase